jgi:hypothetical protein
MMERCESLKEGSNEADIVRPSITLSFLLSNLFTVANILDPQRHAAPISATEANVDFATAIQESVNHRRLNPRQIQLTSIAGSIGA